MKNPITPQGAGLGFRRELLPALLQEQAQSNSSLSCLNFFEISPENWLNSAGEIGGHYKKNLRTFTEQFDFICHGLSLSIGSTAQLDMALLARIKQFMQTHGISLYTEHLSWCSDNNGHLYDLLPIPCTQEAVKWVAQRIQQAQDFLGQRIGFENASYYFVPPHSDMTDAEFISAVVKESDCLLHLDINNIYVNSQNFGFNPYTYLQSLPLEKVCYIHVAGHYVEEDGFIIDTHGNTVIPEVWHLLSEAYQGIYERTGRLAHQTPTCLERDFNFPSLQELLVEVQYIHKQQQQHSLHLKKRA